MHQCEFVQSNFETRSYYLEVEFSRFVFGRFILYAYNSLHLRLSLADPRFGRDFDHDLQKSQLIICLEEGYLPNHKSIFFNKNYEILKV